MVDKEQMQLAGKIKSLLAAYNEARDLINIGAYNKGSDPLIDEAIDKMPAINEFLQQAVGEKIDYETTLKFMQEILK